MDSVLGTIFAGLVAGVIIGPLARLILPGRQHISLIMTIGIGAVGAIGGGLIYGSLGGADTPRVDWIKLAIQVVVAVVLVIAYGRMQDSNA